MTEFIGLSLGLGYFGAPACVSVPPGALALTMARSARRSRTSLPTWSGDVADTPRQLLSFFGL